MQLKSPSSLTVREKVPCRVYPRMRDACRALAGQIAEMIRKRAEEQRHLVLGLATGTTPVAIYDELVRRNIFVRYFDLPGLTDKLRITVGTNGQNDRLIQALKEILS